MPDPNTNPFAAAYIASLDGLIADASVLTRVLTALEGGEDGWS